MSLRRLGGQWGIAVGSCVTVVVLYAWTGVGAAGAGTAVTGGPCALSPAEASRIAGVQVVLLDSYPQPPYVICEWVRPSESKILHAFTTVRPTGARAIAQNWKQIKALHEQIRTSGMQGCARAKLRSTSIAGLGLEAYSRVQRCLLLSNSIHVRTRNSVFTVKSDNARPLLSIERLIAIARTIARRV